MTVARLLAVPVLAWLVIGPSYEQVNLRWLAFVIFLLAAISDLIDGKLARSRGQVTTFGKIADPIADKALIAVMLVGLSWQGRLWWWVTIAILVREVAVTLVRLSLLKKHVIPADQGGKLKTVLQDVAVGAMLVPVTGWWQTFADVAMAVALVVTIATGVTFFYRLATAKRATSVADEIIEFLTSSGQSVAVAESLTGGSVNEALTSPRGASLVVRGGVVAYDASVKEDLLQVGHDLITRHGVVSSEVAQAMAKGVREHLGATWGVATTGVAGPGMVDQHFPGTVFVAVAGPTGTTASRFDLVGDRASIRTQTTDTALKMLLHAIRGARTQKV